MKSLFVYGIIYDEKKGEYEDSYLDTQIKELFTEETNYTTRLTRLKRNYRVENIKVYSGDLTRMEL